MSNDKTEYGYAYLLYSVIRIHKLSLPLRQMELERLIVVRYEFDIRRELGSRLDIETPSTPEYFYGTKISCMFSEAKHTYQNFDRALEA